MKSEYLRCYIGNLDGMRQGLVIAHNQKEAAKIAGDSLYHFRNYWSANSDWPKQKLKPMVLYTRSNNAKIGEEFQEGICEIKRKK